MPSRTAGGCAGAVIVAAGTTVAILATAVVVPHYAPGGGSPFEGRYAAVGGSPAGIVRGAVRAPAPPRRGGDRAPRSLLSRRPARYRSAACRSWRRFSRRAPLPELALNLLSDTRTQTSIHFHYTAAAIPGLVMAAVLGAARVQRRWPGSSPILGRALVLLVLASGVVLGPLPVWAHVPFGSKLATRDHVVTDARSRRGASPAGGAERRPRERDQHPRCASLRATADLQLSGDSGGEVGRRRPDAPELPRRRARQAVSGRLCGVPARCPLAPRPGRGRRRRLPARLGREGLGIAVLKWSRPLDRNRLGEEVEAEDEAGCRSRARPRRLRREAPPRRGTRPRGRAS